MEASEASATNVTEQIISKRQLKKQAKREKWLKQKDVRRLKEREVLKEKRKRAKEEGKDLGPSRKELKKSKMSNSKCKVNVVIDLSLDHLMTDRERTKVIKQIQRCYAINRRATDPVQFHVTSYDGLSGKQMQSNQGCEHWDVNFDESDFDEVFDHKDIVYLTSESNNVLSTLDDGKCYVIGGLVDHNRHQGVCYRLAQEKQIDHARLPIDENIVLQTRKVLTIDQVFNILLEVTSGKCWKEALLSVIPQRKQAVPRADLDDDDTSEGETVPAKDCEDVNEENQSDINKEHLENG